jgi:ABC-type transporter Mla subunit MlaD
LLQQSVLPALSEIQGAEQAARQHGDELAQTLQKVQELQGQLTHLSRKADAAFTQLVAEQSTLQLLQGPLKDDPAAVGCVTTQPARAPPTLRAHPALRAQ